MPLSMESVLGTMPLSLSFLAATPLFCSHPKILAFRPQRPNLPRVPRLKAQHGSQEQSLPQQPRWESLLATAASLYPLYVTAGGAVACVKPSAFSWFVGRGPGSYSCTLGFIMLAMGLTLDLKDFLRLIVKRPLSVTLIAQGDVPLSIVMTACTTLAAVFLTPLLTQILAGAYVPVDAVGLSISTLQVVVAPLVLGSYMQKAFPAFVKVVTPFAPLLAVLASSLLASSVFSENLFRLKQSMVAASNGSDLVPSFEFKQILSGDLRAVILSVILLHFAGFFVGGRCG